MARIFNVACVVVLVACCIACSGPVGPSASPVATKPVKSTVATPTPSKPAPLPFSKAEEKYIDIALRDLDVPRLNAAKMDVGQVVTLPAVTVKQIVGPITALVELNGKVFFLHGLSTEGIVDDDKVAANGKVFHIARTQGFKNALGATRTVYVVELLDIDRAKAEVEKRKKAKGETGPAAE